MKYFLCNESGELFYMEAKTLEEAEENVIEWNAVVMGEVSKETMDTVNPNTAKVKFL